MSRLTVEVLLSTHNGERYVLEQVESVRAQRGVDVRLTARDDGSTDRTVQRLADAGVDVVDRSSVGLPGTFFRLLQHSADDVDLWALCDQDDVWLPEKLRVAADALGGVDGPGMYCGRVVVSDADLRPLYPHPLPRRGPSFANALVQNIATGCTIVLNRAARAVLRDRWPTSAVMHDAWLYLVLAGTGTVLYDPTISVLYRQHDQNSVGMGSSRRQRLARRVRRQVSPGGAGAHGRQNAELARTHLDLLLPEARSELTAFVDAQARLRTRARYALTGPAHRQDTGSDLVRRGLQVVGRI